MCDNHCMKLFAVLIAMLFVQSLHAQELRDPTRPGGYAGAALTENADIGDGFSLQLQAIFFHPTKSSALINGRRFIEGDQLGQMQIVKIFADRVVLSDNTSESELKMPIPAVISRPENRISGSKE